MSLLSSRTMTVLFLIGALLLGVLCRLPPALAVCTDLPGDVTQDGVVTVVDIQCEILGNLWALAGGGGGMPACVSGNSELFDLDCNGVNNIADTIVVITLTLGAPLDLGLDTNQNLCLDSCEPAWIQLGGVGLPVTRIRAIAVNAAGHIFAACWGFGIYRSTDGGATFTKLGTPNTVNNPGVLAIPTMALNDLGEPVLGVSPAGSGTTYTVVFRLDTVANTWITSTVSHPMNLGGYFPPAFRLDTNGHLLSSWPFRNDIMRSVDHGNTWTNAFPIPNGSHIPPNGPSPLVKAVYGVACHPTSGELFCGTEGDQWWHSTDEGATWAMVDAGGTSNLALEPGQNGLLVAFNKDGEPLIGTQGKADGNFLMRLKSDGTIVPSNNGFGPWAMVGTASAPTVLRELVMTDEGHQFLAMPVNNGKGGAVPCDLWGSHDGSTWEKKFAPFVPELNSVAVYGTSVLVGGGAQSPGVIWKFTPVVTNHLPKVSTGVPAGESVVCGLQGQSFNGEATDADGDILSYTWKARGPGTVTFGDANNASTTASFSVAGDYVLTLHVSDGHRSAATPVIAHVMAGK